MSNFKQNDLALLILSKNDPHYKAALNRPVRLLHKVDPLHRNYNPMRERWFFEFVDGKSFAGRPILNMAIPADCLELYNYYPAPAKPEPKGLPSL